MARARWWVDDHSIGRTVRKRRGQRTLVTGFGVPILRLGAEDPRWLLASRSMREPSPATVARWDALLLASAFADEHAANALGFTGERVEDCWPWLQSVIARRTPHARHHRGADRPLVVIAPVHPTLISGGLDLSSLAQGLGREVAMVVRRPDGRAVPVPPDMRFGVIDAADDDDTAGLVASADLLVTDGSSWAVAASVVGIPVLWFAPRDLPADVEPLRRVPGFTIPESTLVPIASSTGEVIDVVRRWLADPRGALSSDFPHREDLTTMAGMARPDAAARALAALRGIS